MSVFVCVCAGISWMMSLKKNCANPVLSNEQRQRISNAVIWTLFPLWCHGKLGTFRWLGRRFLVIGRFLAHRQFCCSHTSESVTQTNGLPVEIGKTTTTTRNDSYCCVVWNILEKDSWCVGKRVERQLLPGQSCPFCVALVIIDGDDDVRRPYNTMSFVSARKEKKLKNKSVVAVPCGMK